MKRYQLGAHTKHDLKVHLVWIPKYHRSIPIQLADLLAGFIRYIHEVDIKTLPSSHAQLYYEIRRAYQDNHPRFFPQGSHPHVYMAPSMEHWKLLKELGKVEIEWI